VDTRRIADAKSRAGQLEEVASAARRTFDADDSGPLAGSILLPLAQLRAATAEGAPPVDRAAAAISYYGLMRERARVLSADSPHAVLAYYTRNLRDDSGFDTPVNRYGHALALVQVGRAKEAVAELDPVAARHPGDLVIQLGLAAAADQAGERARATQIYDRLNRDFPGNRAVSLAYADSLLARADTASAQRA